MATPPVLIIDTGHCVAVRGDVGTDGTAIYETWYAKVVGVDGDRSEDNDSGSETSSDRLNVQVVWFHEAKDALQWLPKKVTHKERAMIKDALHEDVYLLGTAPQYIEQDAILHNVIAVDISRLLSTVLGVDDKRILYRWKFNLPPDRAEIEAEMWCTKDCPRNRFWKITEVMWFCLECEFWYHLDCCRTEHSKKSYTTPEDFEKMPLLKGGACGPIGTGPLVCVASQVLGQIQQKGGSTATVDWKQLMTTEMGMSVDDYLDDLFKGMGGLVHTDVNCPACVPVE